MGVIELTDEQKTKYTKEMYDTFVDGFEFERFLEIFLEKIGLEDVSITRQTRDGGIDLTCSKRGIDGLFNLDITNYYVQAKRYLPEKKIPVSSIRELRGIMPPNYKGIFITTAGFTSDAKKEATNDSTREIILIDGESLLTQLVDHQIGFDFKPIFNPGKFAELFKQVDTKNEGKELVGRDRPQAVRRITLNDARARILPIPKVILEQIDPEVRTVEIIINGITDKLNIDLTRRFLSGITKYYREFGLITESNTYETKDSKWYIKDGVIEVVIE